MPAKPEISKAASWLINAGAEDTRIHLDSIAGTPDEQAVLEEAIAYEESRPKPRVSRLKPIHAALKRVATLVPALANPKSAKSEITDAQPRDPAWDAARETADQIRTAGRLFLRGQVRLGMILSGLKKEHGIQHGGNRKNQVPDSGTCSLNWPDLVQQETGYSRQSADVFIRLFDATRAKLKTSRTLKLPAKAKKDTLALFLPETALTLSEEQWGQVDQVIASLTDGETQASLMQELGVLPKPKPMPKGGANKNPSSSPEQTAGQLAFHFFDGLGSAMINTRLNPDYQKLLHALPVESTEEFPLSRTLFKNEARGILADIERIERIEAQAAKPAKGRVIPKGSAI